MATLFFTSCEPKEPSGNDNTPEKIGVEINGVVWSPYNVGETPLTFTNTPEEYGGYYQWNKGTSDFMLYDVYEASSFYNATSWLPQNDPSPKGWRVPTRDEFYSLYDDDIKHEWTTENGIKGRRFTDTISGNSIFLPAAGYRDDESNLLLDVEMYGCYWTSTGFKFEEYIATGANALYFNAYGVMIVDPTKATGLSVRPVAK